MLKQLAIDVSSQNLSREDTDRLLTAIVRHATNRIYENWWTIAGNGLTKSRDIYQRSLIVADRGRFEGAVVLLGSLPNMIEEGVGAFDMKVGFSQSPKVKFTKSGGWYLTVPFRIGTPGTIGTNFASVMPQEIYDVAKDLSATTSQPGVGVVYGDRLGMKDIPAKYATPNIRGAFSDLTNRIANRFGEYEAKSSIYKGMIREEKTYQGATQSQYMTFRRVSFKSNPNSWIHTGIAPHKFAEQAEMATDLDRETEVIINSFLNSL